MQKKRTHRKRAGRASGGGRCYARKHVKVLPKYLDLKPVKIDYRLPGGTSGFGGKKRPKRTLELSRSAQGRARRGRSFQTLAAPLLGGPVPQEQ